MNLYGQTEIIPEQKPERSWWWIGPVILAIGLLIWLCGCATFKCDVTMPDGTKIKAETATFLKNIKIDPNDGAMSIVSPETPGIIEALLGGIAGFFIAGG